MSDPEEQVGKEEDLNPVIMKGKLSFIDGIPTWKGLWNYKISSIPDQIKQKRTFFYNRSSTVHSFLQEQDKSVLNNLYEKSSRAVQSNDMFIRNRRLLFVCELSGTYEGNFLFESVRYPINETFNLYCPSSAIQFQKCWIHNPLFTPLDHTIFFEGYGENEFGLFNCSVAINIFTGYIELMKLYANPIVSPTSNILSMNPKDAIETARAKRQKHNSGTYQHSCCICLCPASSINPLIQCTRCHIYVHEHCYKISCSSHLLSHWICDSCLYSYNYIHDYLYNNLCYVHDIIKPDIKSSEIHSVVQENKDISILKSTKTTNILSKEQNQNSDVPQIKQELSSNSTENLNIHIKRPCEQTESLKKTFINLPQCSHCPWPGGILKRDIDGQWIHALCSLTTQYSSILDTTSLCASPDEYSDTNDPISMDTKEFKISTLCDSSLTVHTEPLQTVYNKIENCSSLPYVNTEVTPDNENLLGPINIEKDRIQDKTINIAHTPVSHTSLSESISPHSTICSLCHIPKGTTYRCNHEDCQCWMHPLCAQYFKGYLFYTNNSENDLVYMYCPEHVKEGIEFCKQQNNIMHVNYNEKNEVYEGEYKNGYRDGNGKCYYNDCYIYDGEWMKDKENGKGSLYHNNRCLYYGDFTEGKISGNGEFYYDNGDLYYGNVREGMRHMTGTYISHNNEIYQGDWKEDRKHGTGIYLEMNKGKYNGDYIYDMREGHGILELNNGITFNGNFKNNSMDGSGDMIYSDKSRYRGMFKNGRREGRGTYTWANSVIYEGHFKNDKIDGVGNVIIDNYIQATKNDIYIPIILLQGSLQEIHYSSGLIDNNP